jgi:hypothetical protein
MLTATVSGSFHRHLHDINLAVQELTLMGVRVLSPADPRIVDSAGEFLFVASDRVRSVLLVQDRHRQCIRASDFLWLVAPDGYVGSSAAFEIGSAVADEVPVVGTHLPSDLTLRQYVREAKSMRVAIAEFEQRPRRLKPTGFLIDPHASVEAAHSVLDRIAKQFTGQHPQATPAAAVSQISQSCRELSDLLVFSNNGALKSLSS